MWRWICKTMFTAKKVFVTLLILRVLLTLLPQTGYIHPDEFFQSAEIIAGDTLDLEVLRTWEFNCTSPIRSMFLPYVTIGLPIWILKTFFTTTPYSLLIGPRLLMATLSISTDIFLHRICKILSTKQPFRIMTVHASSYVLLAFLPRTLSNSTEYLLFAATIYLVIKHLTQTSNVSKRIKTNTISLGIVTATGFFNRPTFPCFALVPGLAWLYGFVRLNRRIAEISSNLIRFAATFLATSSIFILFDSLYYGNFVVTPYNFLSYNSDTSKLNLHGLHPRVTHSFLNVPMLFGVLGIAGYFSIVKWLRVAAKKCSRLSRVSNVSFSDGLMMASFLVPILLLSAFPHQEARFIIPVFFPLVLITSKTLTNGGMLVTRLLIGLWIAGNLAGVLFFGFFHQGGVIPALFHLNELETDSKSVIFYRTYMPPRHLLMMDASSPKYDVKDVMGGSLESLQEMLNNESIRSNILLVSPTSLRYDIVDYLFNFRFTLLKRFACHVSTEDLPPCDGGFLRFLSHVGLDIHRLARVS